ncbi:MAG: hypothetical protein ACRDNG_07375, partial [Gaiellaceae bacterium]
HWHLSEPCSDPRPASRNIELRTGLLKAAPVVGARRSAEEPPRADMLDVIRGPERARKRRLPGADTT